MLLLLCIWLNIIMHLRKKTINANLWTEERRQQSERTKRTGKQEGNMEVGIESERIGYLT